ncbi:MAG TPA: HD domain-containing protein [Bacteroidales bacterium]|nr:HD domain-containing protein [Bacteroidales bacterium]HPS16330.1 HD domain-containing protein [Bacteroidales bacterium]
MNFQEAKEFILNKLKNELKPRLYYHCLSHTLDVYESAKKLAAMENITGKDLILLETAALYHDSGFLFGYCDHEQESVMVTRKYLSEFDYTDEDIDIICNMILATRLPQNPKTLLEKILCDADLDYLGRDDFFMIANRLLCEWNEHGHEVSLKKWYHIQVDFLEKNNYFTESAIALRNEKKNQNLTQIQTLIN